MWSASCRLLPPQPDPVTRPRLALIQRVAKDVAARRRPRGRRTGSPPTADGPTADGLTVDELARRLDETRERLRREIPPPDSEQVP
jgi:hypothetical protein